MLLRESQVRTDWAGLIEEWGKRFFAEMDYEAEAASADLFAIQMEGLPGIVVPAVYHELTNQRVLTTDWIEGVPLTNAFKCACTVFWSPLIICSHSKVHFRDSSVVPLMPHCAVRIMN